MIDFLNKWFKSKDSPIKYTITIKENPTGNLRLEAVMRCGKDFEISEDFPKAIYPLILHLATIENEKRRPTNATSPRTPL